MKKTGKIGSILCLLALLGLTGIYALPKVYVLYQANTGKVDICLKEYMLEEGKEVPWENLHHRRKNSYGLRFPLRRTRIILMRCRKEK